MKKPFAIIIMDGYGINPEKKGNAIELEGSPNVKRYEKEDFYIDRAADRNCDHRHSGGNASSGAGQGAG